VKKPSSLLTPRITTPYLAIFVVAMILLFAAQSRGLAEGSEEESEVIDREIASEEELTISKRRRKKHLREEVEEYDDEEEDSFAHRVLWYLPNRLLDVTDLVRARLRVGPGAAIDARATKFIRAGLGSYLSLYAGLPGPRQRTTPRSPIGLEAYSGVSLSVAEASFETGYEPDYSPSEVGIGFQLLILGIDVGIDPLEVGDLISGLVGIDLVGDDF
jgi:hypothetical protein